jgi:hypothetical protein
MAFMIVLTGRHSQALCPHRHHDDLRLAAISDSKRFHRIIDY